MGKRYSVQWRKPYRARRLRKAAHTVYDTRDELRLAKLFRRAVKGDTDAISTILKATGDLPEDFKLTD